MLASLELMNQYTADFAEAALGSKNVEILAKFFWRGLGHPSRSAVIFLWPSTLVRILQIFN